MYIFARSYNIIKTDSKHKVNSDSITFQFLRLTGIKVLLVRKMYYFHLP